MILIADGGTTKCDWLGCDMKDNSVLFETTSKGLNPAYTPQGDLLKNLSKSNGLNRINTEVREIYFFGSGCGEGLFEDKLKSALYEYFPNAVKIFVSGDIQGAVYSCTNQPGVVAILGTGSNICYYDGNKIEFRIPSLGYTIMDQGSGNAIGKKLLKGYFFRSMPGELYEKFDQEYDLDIDHIKTSLYNRPAPSSYLASFARFCYDNIEHSYIQSLLEKTLEEFFETSVNCYKDYLQKHPIHFVGSIAFHSSDFLQEICIRRHITLGNIVQRPIEGLHSKVDWLRSNCD